jgi:hypothetical protein
MFRQYYGYGRRIVPVGLLACVVSMTTMARAETLYYFEPHTGRTELVNTANPGRHATPQIAHAMVGGGARGGNLTFNVTYQDVAGNTNVGFDDNSLGATRQATLEAVLAYVDDILNATSGATIDVTVNASEMDSGGFLAFAGTYFNGVAGFYNGFCLEHIMTGTDPNGTVSDIFITVDFGFPWNSDMGTVGGGEYDLYTVLLHEVTHGLGFLGLVESDGTSSTSGGNPGEYSVLNQLTHLDQAGPIGTGATTQMWTTAMGASYVGTAGNLISGRMVFTGPNAVAAYGSNPTINSNNPFAPGTSMSHWGDNLAGMAVMPGFVFLGVETREYADFEIGALVDIGYPNASTGPPPVPDTDQDLLSDDDEVIEGTNPNDPDSDNDGVLDGTEVELGTDPLDGLDFPILPVGATLALVAVLGAAGVLFVRKRRGASGTR